MENVEIPLNEVPEVFFDQTKWCEVVAFYGTRQKALEQVSQVEPGIFVYYRRENAKIPTLEGAKAAKEEHFAELSKGLVAHFKERLIKEEIIATGFSSLSVERARIPGERWTELWIDFAEDSAKGGQLKFTRIRVFQPIDARTAAADLLDRCRDWMQNRARAGESRRKVLQTEAMRLFGPDLTTRLFDAAYQAVFSKSRGRPRNRRPE